jgi:leader peptidase (prepilin peptidase)/N-methyltransferase
MIFLWVLFFSGLCLGSFLNVVIYRLPFIMLESFPENSKVSFFSPVRSFSPCCRRSLPWWQLIPVLSFLFLKGKCFFCQEKVSKQYPLVELVCGLGFMLSFWRFGLTEEGFAAMLFLSVSLCLGVIDLRHMLLPDTLTLGLLWLGLLFNLGGVFSPLESAVLGAVLGYLILCGIYWVFKFFTGKEGLGYGDFKLMAALGAWFGAMALPGMFLIAGILGLIFGVAWRWFKPESSPEFPFGPALVFTGIIELFCGNFLLGL